MYCSFEEYQGESFVVHDRVAKKGSDRKWDEYGWIKNAQKKLSNSEMIFDSMLIEAVSHSEHVYTSIRQECEDKDGEFHENI